MSRKQLLKRLRRNRLGDRMTLAEFRKQVWDISDLWKKDPKAAAEQEHILCQRVLREVWKGNKKAKFMAREMQWAMVNHAHFYIYKKEECSV